MIQLLIYKWICALGKEAGDALVKAATCILRRGEKDEACSYYVDASKAYRKIHPQDTIDVLKKAVDILAERGRFSAAASHQKTIGEIYEVDIVDLEKAQKAYEVAADWLLNEESKAQAAQCLLKAATFAAQLEQYASAIDKFEQVAIQSLDNNLTKWSVRQYLFNAALCHLASGDLVGSRRAIERYQGMDATFSSTRECEFLLKLLQDLENGEVDSYTQHVVDFDNLTKLDSWKTTILLRIKKSIAEEISIT